MPTGNISSARCGKAENLRYIFSVCCGKIENLLWAKICFLKDLFTFERKVLMKLTEKLRKIIKKCAKVRENTIEVGNVLLRGGKGSYNIYI